MATTLSVYLTQTRQLLNDQAAQQQYSDSYLTPLINEGRQWVAAAGECVRYLTPSSNGLASITVTSAGANYVGPTITIAPPDAISSGAGGITATATAQLSGGTINSITIVNAGSGYFNAPAVTITDASGTGATATATVGYVNQTFVGQETYSFTSVQFPASSGIKAVNAVRSIALIWGTFRYTVMRASFTKYQSYARNYTNNYLYIPAIATQYAQGQAGTFLGYPVASQSFPMEWDCICVPIDLASDADPEAIPAPWTLCVQFYSAYKALLGRGRFADSEKMNQQFMHFMNLARSTTMPGVANNMYGRA